MSTNQPGRRLASAAAAVALAAAVAHSAAGEAEPRNVMHDIFDAFAQLLPIALDDDRYLEEETQRKMGELLDGLIAASDGLSEHAGERDADFQYHAEALAADVVEAHERHERGLPEEARFFVITATQNCVSCHTRLPKARDFPLAPRLTKSSAISTLDGAERALFRVATRSFDEALDEFEAFLLDPGTHPLRVAQSDTLEQYLVTALRVQRDPERASRFLGQLRRRDDVPEAFHAMVELWRTDLATYASALVGEPDLAFARAIVTGAPPAETRDALARDIVASSILLRWIDARKDDARARSEAYYWLGVIGDRHSISFWRPETAVHLERAIRLAPDAPYAELALERLRSHWHFHYGGSSGSHLTAEHMHTLDLLRDLISQHSAGAAH